jgi:hypothetical protein
MHISTKTLATLAVVTAVAAAVPGISRLSSGGRRRESQFDRLLHRHDRKGDLRADVLGMNPAAFKVLQKKLPFDEIARRQGFPNKRAFRMALLGKLKNELRMRGWTTRRIDQYVTNRSERMG